MNKTEKQHSKTWQSVCDEFFSTQQANFMEPLCPLPSIKLPRYIRALPYRPTVNEKAFSTPEMDITEDVLFHFAESGRKDIRLKAFVHRIPVVKNGCFRVVSAFLSPESDRLVDGGDVTFLREYIERKYELFRREEGLPTLHYFFIIGSERPFDQDCQALAQPTVVLCHPLESHLWDFRLPPDDIDMPTVDFLLHVLPGQRNAYADAMKNEIDSLKEQLKFITQDMLRERLQLDPSTYHGFLTRWLDTLFARKTNQADSSEQNFLTRWLNKFLGHGGYARDDRGYIYGPGMTFLSKYGGRYCRQYDATPSEVNKLNAVCVLCAVLFILFIGLWLFGNVSGLSSQLVWWISTAVVVGCQWYIWHLQNRSVR